MSEQFQLSVTREEADYLKDLARWSILQGLKRKALPTESEVDGPPEGSEVLYSAGEPPVGYLVRRDDLFTAVDVASAQPAANGDSLAAAGAVAAVAPPAKM